jgi:competence protein ComEC
VGNLTKGKLMIIIVSVLVAVLLIGLLAVKDVRNGILGALGGTVGDTVSLVNTKPAPVPVSGPIPSPAPKAVQTPDVPKAKDNLKVYVLNSSGTAVIAVDGKTAVLLDGSDGTDADSIAAQIKELGVSNLRYVVATNYHPSAIGGLPKIMSYFSVDYIFMSQNVATDKKGENLRKYLESKQLIYTVPSGRAKFKLETASFELLPTHDGGSIVTLVTNGANKFVFTGDINRVDDPLIAELPVGVDMYSVSSRNDFYDLPDKVLDRIKPKNIIIGAVGDNAGATTRAVGVLNNRELTTYKTAQCGNVVVGSNGTEVNFKCDNETEKK